MGQMTLLEVLKRRRAVKHYDPDHRLSDAELRRLLTAGALAPSSFNMQNRHFVCVTDPQIKARLSSVSWGQEQVRDASVVFVITGNRNAYKTPDRYVRNAPTAVRERFEMMLPKFYADDRMARDEDCRSVALAAMNVMLMATEMDYESCPMIGFQPAEVSKILGLPDDHEPLMFVVVGRGSKAPSDRLGLLSLEEIASLDHFGTHMIAGDQGEE